MSAKITDNNRHLLLLFFLCGTGRSQKHSKINMSEFMGRKQKRRKVMKEEESKDQKLEKLRNKIINEFLNQNSPRGRQFLDRMKRKRKEETGEKRIRRNNEERIKTILRVSSALELKEEIYRFGIGTLKRMFRVYVSNGLYVPPLEFNMKTYEIAKAFFGQKVPDFEKRRQEEINIGKTLPTVQHQYFGKTLVPRDIIAHIMKFLMFDSNLLFGFGSTCKNLYVTVLLFWPEVTIRNGNLYEQSILVLRSVKTLSIFADAGTFYDIELKYLWKTLSLGNQITRLIIQDYWNCQVLYSLVTFMKKNKNKIPFPKVTRVSVKGKAFAVSGIKDCFPKECVIPYCLTLTGF